LVFLLKVLLDEARIWHQTNGAAATGQSPGLEDAKVDAVVMAGFEAVAVVRPF
jgi:hypothetical protein